MVWYDMVWSCMVWYGLVWFGLVLVRLGYTPVGNFGNKVNLWTWTSVWKNVKH